MSEGNWIPMCKGLTLALPLGRPYSIIEAVFSFEVDFNNGEIKSMRDYARIWDWPRHKVESLLNGRNTTQPKVSQNPTKTRPVKVRLLNNLEGKVSQVSAKTRPVSDHNYKNKEKEEEKDLTNTGSNPPLKESVKGGGGGEKKIANGEVKEIVDYLNEVAGTSYRPTSSKTQQLIQARMNEGFNVVDFEKVIDNKVSSWKDDEKYSKYIRPETLFGTKFEGYLNEKPSIKPSQELNMVDILTEAYENN